MKAILFLILISCAGCVVHTDEPLPCGYYDEPYYEPPVACRVNPWTFEGDCCTWRVQDFYSECVETWCYKEERCEWQVQKYTCYPI